MELPTATDALKQTIINIDKKEAENLTIEERVLKNIKKSIKRGWNFASFSGEEERWVRKNKDLFIDNGYRLIVFNRSTDVMWDKPRKE